MHSFSLSLSFSHSSSTIAPCTCTRGWWWWWWRCTALTYTASKNIPPLEWLCCFTKIYRSHKSLHVFDECVLFSIFLLAAPHPFGCATHFERCISNSIIDTCMHEMKESFIYKTFFRCFLFGSIFFPFSYVNFSLPSTDTNAWTAFLCSFFLALAFPLCAIRYILYNFHSRSIWACIYMRIIFSEDRTPPTQAPNQTFDVVCSLYSAATICTLHTHTHNLPLMSYSISFYMIFFLSQLWCVLLLFVYHPDCRIEHCHYQYCWCCALSTRNTFFFCWCLVIAEKITNMWVYIIYISIYLCECTFFCRFVSFVPWNFVEWISNDVVFVSECVCRYTKKEISNTIPYKWVQKRLVCCSF